MPRVTTRNKTGRGKQVRCGKCGKPIEAGQRYHTWTFRYGGSRYQHADCGYPRQSQLTQSRMSDVYAALESVEDIMAGEPDTWCVDDVVNGLNEAAQTATEISEEARSTADEHFGGGGPHAERADEFESIASEIEGVRDEVEQVEEGEESDPEHEVETTETDNGLTRVRCTVCDEELVRTFDIYPEGTFDQEWDAAVKRFIEEHPEDEEDADDGEEPWYDQVRELVNGLSI